jgi:hypothetical protein
MKLPVNLLCEALLRLARGVAAWFTPNRTGGAGGQDGKHYASERVREHKFESFIDHM